jgi:hypothetical protein
MAKAQFPMTNFIPILRRFRGFRAAALLALVAGHSTLGMAAAPAATVVGVQPARMADLVLLGGGFNAGLRQGMVCRISRGTAEIAEVLLVELRPTCSAALILNVAPRQSIRAGDLAAIKVLKT